MMSACPAARGLGVVAATLAAVAVLVALLVLGVTGPASAHEGEVHDAPPGGASRVDIGFRSFTPRTTQLLVGDTVTWDNASVRAHTVTADDGSFDAGRLRTGGRFVRRFDAEAVVPYHCELHAGMTGTVVVQRLLLDAPAQTAAPRRAFPLTGRAASPAGSEVRVQADTGKGFVDAGRASVQEDGSFRVLVTPTTTGRYRAVAGTVSSRPVDLRVTDRRIAFTAARRAGGAVALDAKVTPGDPGSPVVLQLYLPERFGWWPVASVKLDRASHARFTYRLRRRVAARVVLTLPDRATPLAISAPRRIGTPRRTARR